MQKCYGVTIAGKVQDIGFRDFIENIARSHFLKGIVFNDIGSTVKIVCCGDNTVINDFFEEVKSKGNKAGIILNITDKKELPLEIPLPGTFTKVSTDDVEDIGRKLDKGNVELNRINDKLITVDERLFGIDEKLFGIDERLFGIDEKLLGIDGKLIGIDEKLLGIDENTRNLNTTMSSFVVEQREHNQFLEKILEKLAK